MWDLGNAVLHAQLLRRLLEPGRVNRKANWGVQLEACEEASELAQKLEQLELQAHALFFETSCKRI